MTGMLSRIAPYLGLLFFLIAIAVVHHELQNYQYADIVSVIKATPWYLFLLGLLFTVFNYVTLTGYDFLALHHIGKKLPKLRVMLASMAGFAVSNNVGHAMISGPSVRYRFYNAWGLSGTDIIKLTLFLSIMYLLGTMTLAVIAFFMLPQTQIVSGTIHPVIHLVIYTAATILVLYWLAILFLRKPFTIRDIRFTLPSVKITASQTLVAGVDLILASLTLYVFLQHNAPIPFTTFLLVYLVAQVIGLYSQVPGGLGVFEGAFLYLIGDTIPAHQVLAALTLYRVVYYFVPLAIAGIGMMGYELYQRREAINDKTLLLRRTINQNIPQIFSLLLLLAGVIMLLSGVVPRSTGALSWLGRVLPLSVIEVSHLLGSVVGIGLLLLARAVRMRINAAYFVSLVLLSLGIIASLLKGFDWQEASILGLLLLLMLPTRRFFYRESALLNTPFSASWFVLIFIVLAASFWLGLFSYKHVEYQDSLWWQFELQSEASRFLRSQLVIVLVFFGFAILRLLRLPFHTPQLPTPDEIVQAESLIKEAESTQAHLALLGDKSLLWSPNKRAFVMYVPGQKYWIVMGDPVGSTDTLDALCWQLREMADRKGAKLAYYQVSKNNLPIYLDQGLVLVKLGEEALVPLQEFGLEGSARSGLRQTNNKMTRLGNVTFEILGHEQVLAHMAELKTVSDQWLAYKRVSEKGFSLGFFDADYIKRTRVAVVRQAGNIVAFANLWETRSKQELSIDLMRYLDTAPSGVMEWLFIQLMLWGRMEGYRYFNLGMAPLAGLETHELAPLWHKIGNVTFEHGGDFYNFEGLRSYKDKFDPIWEPRYLAVPHGFNIPMVLIAVTRIIAGGKLTKAFKK